MLQSLKIINSNERISSIDIFRGLAIIPVVIFHFNDNFFPHGNIGVDLFFVISGLLIGGLLINEFKSTEKINFFTFFLRRGFKIWPSYYFYILAGSLIAMLFYGKSDPSQIIPIWDLPRYLLFYENYTGLPFHYSFGNVWSLCVEEHFYILLPILFILIQSFIQKKSRTSALFIFTILTIIAGVCFKFASFYLTNSQDTYSGTHNRIDALAWGVLLSLVINYYPGIIKNKIVKITAFISGILILFFSLWYSSEWFDKLVLHSLIPLSFSLLIASLYYVNFQKVKPIRFVAYYSYNWYLWHPIFVIFIKAYFGESVAGLLVYLIVTFSMAVTTTILIEEPFLKFRKRFSNTKIKTEIYTQTNVLP